MFFLHEIERDVMVHPSYFGPHVQSEVANKLLKDIEGQNIGNYIVLCVLSNWEMSEGRCIPGSAQAEYTIHFKAVVWKPYKGEIVDGQVASVVDSGFFVDVGPLSVFVAKAVSEAMEPSLVRKPRSSFVADDTFRH